MRVRIYEVNQQTGAETLRGEADFTEALPEPNDEQALAYQELRESGRAWIGGGAAPLILLMRIDR